MRWTAHPPPTAARSTWGARALWALGALASLCASVAAWNQPMWTDAPAPPPALARPTTAEEREIAASGAATLRRAAEATRARLGRAPSAAELEEALAGALPDNPIVPGPASIVEACPAQGDQADWLWCPETGALAFGAPVSGAP